MPPPCGWERLLDGVHISGFWAYFIGALVLGIANGILKPILAIVTLPLIILTLGCSCFVINIAMVALAEWIAPNFSIDGFWNYVGVVAIYPGSSTGSPTRSSTRSRADAARSSLGGLAERRSSQECDGRSEARTHTLRVLVT